MPNPHLSILVVDDTKFSSAIIGRALTLAGYLDVRFASSALDGVASALPALMRAEKLQARAKEKAQCIKSFDCLAHCGLRDGNGKVGQFCIDHQLTLAYQGEGNKGLFFRGVGDLPFGNQIRSVRELITTLLSSDPDLCLQS